jgi:hypothetical protein
MKKVNLSLSIAVATIIFAAATTSAFIKAEGQQGTQSFSGSLSGSNEKPPTKSNSTGTANFQANENNSMISYTFNVTGIKKITQANIRNGSQGENGDIVVVLSKSKSAKGDDRPPKIGFSGKITKDDLTGPLKGKELSDLISLLSKGNAYVNIQTEKYPKGAIRAQIASSETGATSNETLTRIGNATNATMTTTNETASAVTPAPVTEQQPPAENMSAMNATNATMTTTNETASAVTPAPVTEQQPPAENMSAMNATMTTTNETAGTTSEASTFPANQSTSAPNLDIDESMR